VELFARNTKVDALKQAPLFDGLSRKELAELARVAEDVDVEAGRILCREGKSGREFFMIMEGEADVTQNGRHLTTCGRGDFFGEVALIDAVPRTATVTARTATRFFVITRQNFLRLLDEQPGIERKVLRALARRLAPVGGDPTVADWAPPAQPE
jgi:CRP/FNR family cyclic AMP-dependent transcriptional regulator